MKKPEESWDAENDMRGKKAGKKRSEKPSNGSKRNTGENYIQEKIEKS